jgi:hypothetical protein
MRGDDTHEEDTWNGESPSGCDVTGVEHVRGGTVPGCLVICVGHTSGAEWADGPVARHQPRCVVWGWGMVWLFWEVKFSAGLDAGRRRGVFGGTHGDGV